MTYAKLINQYPQFAPNPILHDGLWYGNPPGEIYEAEGYKEVYQDDYPGEDPEEGYYWKLTWTETDAAILGHWVLAPIPVEPE